jgi:hypothetical protein
MRNVPTAALWHEFPPRPEAKLWLDQFFIELWKFGFSIEYTPINVWLIAR